MPLNASTSITQQDLHTLDSSQFFLITAFHSLLADGIARVVIVIVVHLFLRHFCHITQDVGTMICGITPNGAFTNVKAMKTEHFLLKDTILLCRDLWHEKLLGIGGIARILVAILDECHAFVKLLPCDANSVTEVKCVEVLDLTHDDHNVIGRLIECQQLSIAVINDTTCGEDDIVEESIVVSTGLVFSIRKLQKSQTDDIAKNNDQGYTGKYKLTIFVNVVFHDILQVKGLFLVGV